MGHVRLHPDDLAHLSIRADLTPGAFEACSECLAKCVPVVSTRLQRTQAIDDRGQKVYRDRVTGEPTADGSAGDPVMTLAPGIAATGFMLL